MSLVSPLGREVRYPDRTGHFAHNRQCLRTPGERVTSSQSLFVKTELPGRFKAAASSRPAC
jgi:hypothetical protein